ncbi:MAG: hypothetical protein LVQ95_01210 [Candidatus Micrarchaeales archaeon]|nr:hypothetical protein [Candidatus Micrarchaeales archaeon]
MKIIEMTVSFFRDLLKTIIILMILVGLIDGAAEIFSFIINSTNTSPQTSLAYATIILASATVALAYFTYYNAKKEKERLFIKEQLKEFYDPLIYYFTKSLICLDDYNEINKVLPKKSYLARAENEDKIPFHFATFSEVTRPIDVMVTGQSVYSEGWFFADDGLLQKWKGIFDTLKIDREYLANRYRKLHGTETLEASLGTPEPNFHINRMQTNSPPE